MKIIYAPSQTQLVLTRNIFTIHSILSLICLQLVRRRFFIYYSLQPFLLLILSSDIKSNLQLRRFMQVRFCHVLHGNQTFGIYSTDETGLFKLPFIFSKFTSHRILLSLKCLAQRFGHPGANLIS